MVEFLQEPTVELAVFTGRYVEENGALPWFLHYALPLFLPRSARLSVAIQRRRTEAVRTLVTVRTQKTGPQAPRSGRKRPKQRYRRRP
jgi:hypothetical protein